MGSPGGEGAGESQMEGPSGDSQGRPSLHGKCCVQYCALFQSSRIEWKHLVHKHPGLCCGDIKKGPGGVQEVPRELTGGGMGTRPSGAESGDRGSGRKYADQKLWGKLGGKEACELGYGGGVWCWPQDDSKRCSLKMGPHEEVWGGSAEGQLEGRWTVGLLTPLWLLPSHGRRCL